jgi:lipopolysaccharide/colanic/teichoic acid biosynthesis glycosyltransferase
MFDLIQARMDTIGGIPVLAVCETPFCGMNGLVKRASDIVLATLILILISPILLAIAAGVKLTSPGPALFRQRRYGLDGREIVVYKFRSMTVAEDGAVVKQATKNDSRVTPFGAFLRRTSLDELPQFINVLQGRMSIVGPRPHAVAHNEMYRKLVKSYMVRHKVRPGHHRLGAGERPARRDRDRGQDEGAHRVRPRLPAPLVPAPRPAHHLAHDLRRLQETRYRLLEETPMSLHQVTSVPAAPPIASSPVQRPWGWYEDIDAASASA